VVDWKALGYPVVLFPALLPVTLASESDALVLTIAFPCGCLAGFRTACVLCGSLYGLVVGAGIGLLFLVVFTYLATQGRAAPGVGPSIFVVSLGGVFLTIRGLVAGALGGGVGRLAARDRDQQAVDGP